MSFDDYQILNPIGREDSGLWLAWRELPIPARGHYTVYEVSPGRAAEPDMQERMLRAAHVGRVVDHPALVRIHEVLIEDGRAAVVADHVDGVDLERVLIRREAARDPAPLEVSLEIVARVLEAAHHIHRVTDEAGARCYHGRIAPSKVMLTTDGGVKLCGFGVAGDLGERRGPERLGPAADQFAAGLLLLDLVLGRRLALDESLQPSAGRWSRTLKRAIKDVDVESPVAPVLLRMLAVQAACRYPDCGEAAADLRRVHASFGSHHQLPAFAAAEVVAVRTDFPDPTELDREDDLKVPSSEWLVDFNEEDEEEFLETQVDGPVMRSPTVPFSPTFVPRASWYWVDPGVTARERFLAGLDGSEPGAKPDPASQTTLGYHDPWADKELPFDPARSVDGMRVHVPLDPAGSDPRGAAYEAPPSISETTARFEGNRFADPAGSDPYATAMGAAQSGAESSWHASGQDSTATVPFSNTYAPVGVYTRSVPAWVLGRETAPIPIPRRGDPTLDALPDGCSLPPSGATASHNLSLPGREIKERRRRRRRGAARRRTSDSARVRIRGRLRDQARRRRKEHLRDEVATSGIARIWNYENVLEASTAIRVLVAFVVICLLVMMLHVYKAKFLTAPVDPGAIPAPTPFLVD